MASTVLSYTHFLQRDALYDTEKPYSLRFTAPEGFPRANIKLERHDIRVRDVRNERGLEFERDGAQILPLKSRMTYEDYDDDDKVTGVYLKEVANLLKEFLGAQHVQIFEHTVRKRHDIFPISTGEPYRYNQPTSIAHVDTTVQWALALARQLNPQEFEALQKHRVQCVNFWKPITGPVQDWPLALCDSKTIDPNSEFEPCDLVYPDYVVENRQVYFSDKQEWFYISNQEPDEAWVFLQSDTAEDTKPSGFSDQAFEAGTNLREVVHTAIPLPGAAPNAVKPRESIEARALVYYGGFGSTVS